MNTKDYSNKKKANSVLVYIKNEKIENNLKRKEVLQFINGYYGLQGDNKVNNNSWRNAGDERYINSAIPFEELEDDIRKFEPYLRGDSNLIYEVINSDNVDNSDNEKPTDNFVSFQGYDEILQLLNSISNKQVTQFEEIKSLLNNNNTSSEEQSECEDLKAEIEQLKEENKKLKESQSPEIDLNEYVSKGEYEELKAKYEQLKEEKQTSDVDLSEYVLKEKYDKVNEKYKKAVKRVKEQIQPNYEKLQKENEELKGKLEKARSEGFEDDDFDVYEEIMKDVTETEQNKVNNKDKQKTRDLLNMTDEELISDYLPKNNTTEEKITSNLNGINTNNKDEDDSCDFDIYEFLNIKEDELGNNNIPDENITDDNPTNTNDEDMLFDINDVYNI